MLVRYLELQRKELEQLGNQRGQILQRIQREQEREQTLARLLAEMGQGLDLRQLLIRENYYHMRRQMERLWLLQVDKVALARQDLSHLEGLLRAQIGKVKGLELLLRQRADAVQYRQNRQQQQQMDEFNNQRFGR
jgi:Flagellar FliJ protein.